MKLLHIITDEKFPDAAYKQFESILPGGNVYMYPNRKDKIKYLKYINPIRISKFSFYSKDFISSLDNYDAVILHSMTSFALELLSRASIKVKFIWIGMGFDYYDLISEKNEDLLSDQTRQLFSTSNSKSLRGNLRKIIKNFIFPALKNKEKVINRVDIFCPVLVSEYQLIANHLSDFKPKVMEWNYGAQIEMFDAYRNFPLNTIQPNIIIGNSASPNNNHIDIFNQIDASRLSDDTKIIVPLSYGDDEYRRLIIKKGEELFGNKFLPILDFMSISDYALILEDCKVMIMNHKRQQGAGNINLGLLMGHKVFLNDENPLVTYYKDNNINIYSIRSLNNELHSPLDNDIKLSNRSELVNRKSFERHLDNTKKLILQISKLNE